MRLLTIAAAFLCVAAQAPPTPEALLDRYISVTGGADAYRSIRNLYSEGIVSGNLPGLSGSLTTWEAPPDLSLSVLELASGETVKEGTIDGVAWEFSTRGGARIKEGAEKAVALREATFLAKLMWRTYFPNVKMDGEAEIAGKAAWKVSLAPAAGRPITHYYDRDSGLLVRSVIVLDSPQGELSTENDYSDYRPVGGMLMPHRLVHRVRSEQIVVTLLRLEANTGFPMQRFEPPPEVRALIRAR